MYARRCQHDICPSYCCHDYDHHTLLPVLDAGVLALAVVTVIAGILVLAYSSYVLDAPLTQTVHRIKLLFDIIIAGA